MALNARLAELNVWELNERSEPVATSVRWVVVRRLATEKERLVSDQWSVDSKQEDEQWLIVSRLLTLVKRDDLTIDKKQRSTVEPPALLMEIGRSIVKMKQMRSDFDALVRSRET